MRGPNLPKPPANGFGWRWSLAVLFGLMLLAVLLQLRRHPSPAPGRPDTLSSRLPSEPLQAKRRSDQQFNPSSRLPNPTPEQIVAAKLAQFARSRREFAYALARKHDLEVPGDVESLFAAVESGQWDWIEATFKKINGGDSSAGHAERPPGVARLWPAILDAYGVAEQVHLWPAQQLLDYGNSVLGALVPGMVYVGGTDNGRWIPELLNDTSEGEQHVVVTQNALADGTYLDYLQLQYAGRLNNLSEEDSQRAFQDYTADAQKRLQHDQQFPDEPKQVLPGEDIRLVDGRVEVSGQVAVMAINERLLQTLMRNNPEVSFALQESFPLKTTYADALPLGPLMELGAQDAQNAFTPDRATQSLDYWRNMTQQVLSDPQAAGSDSALKSYSHDVDAAANLLAAHNFPAQAEEAYRLGIQLWPASPEAVGRLADLLAATGRQDEARQLLADFTQNYPTAQKDLERISAAVRFLWTARTPGP